MLKMDRVRAIGQRSMRVRWFRTFVCMWMVGLLLAGCQSREPDLAVHVLMMAAKGTPVSDASALQAAWQQRVGASVKLDVQGVPMFLQEKIMAELIVGESSLVLMPLEVFKALGESGGGFVILDDIASKEQYPEGVLPVDDRPGENHLYGIPLAKLGWVESLGLKAPHVIAVLRGQAPRLEEAKQALRALVAEDTAKKVVN